MVKKLKLVARCQCKRLDVTDELSSAPPSDWIDLKNYWCTKCKQVVEIEVLEV